MRPLRMTSLIATAALVLVACNGNVFDLQVGQCFDDPESFEEVSDVPIVDCEEPHDNEVYHLFDLADGDYPGADTVESQAIDGCLATFDSFVGHDYATSELDVRYLYPTEETWNDGDREVVCALFDLSGNKLTGSAEGAAR